MEERRLRLDDKFSIKDMHDIASIKKGRVKVFEVDNRTSSRKLIRDEKNLIVNIGRETAMEIVENYLYTGDERQNMCVAACAIGDNNLTGPGTGPAPGASDVALVSPLKFQGDLGNEDPVSGHPYYQVNFGTDWTHLKALNYEKSGDRGTLNTGNVIEIDYSDIQATAGTEFMAEAMLYFGIPHAAHHTGGAGLGEYLSTNGGGGKFVPCARVTFEPIQKDINRRLVLEWYLYF